MIEKLVDEVIYLVKEGRKPDGSCLTFVDIQNICKSKYKDIDIKIINEVIESIHIDIKIRWFFTLEDFVNAGNKESVWITLIKARFWRQWGSNYNNFLIQKNLLKMKNIGLLVINEFDILSTC